MKRLSLYFLILLCLNSCKSNPQEALVLGTWYNESLMVELDAKSGKIDSVFSVPAGDWEVVMQIKPIETTYASDGTYASDYISLEGEKLQSANGEWKIEGDTLYLKEKDKTTAYHFQWLEGIAVFRGYLDWDNDGLEDDLYTSVQVKRSINFK